LSFTRVHVFRVRPQQELLDAVTSYCRQHAITSGIVIGIIGSVTRARLNYLMALPGKYDGVEYPGPLEIVSAQGSIALKDSNPMTHIHIQLADKTRGYGGHLVTAEVFSTAEVTIAELDYQLGRRFDDYTGLNELSAQ